MSAYANLHIALEQMRVKALREVHGSPMDNSEDRDGSPPDPPRVMIIGPENSGKTTVAKTLINYATRMGQGWSPLLVNVDPSEVSLSKIPHSYCHSFIRIVGRLVGPWCYLCITHTHTHFYQLADFTIRICCYFCTNGIII